MEITNSSFLLFLSYLFYIPLVLIISIPHCLVKTISFFLLSSSSCAGGKKKNAGEICALKRQFVNVSKRLRYCLARQEPGPKDVVRKEKKKMAGSGKYDSLTGYSLSSDLLQYRRCSDRPPYGDIVVTSTSIKSVSQGQTAMLRVYQHDCSTVPVMGAPKQKGETTNDTIQPKLYFT